MVEKLMYNFQHPAKSCEKCCVYFFKNCLPRFWVTWESAELMFSFVFQKLKQNPDLQFWKGKFKFAQLFPWCSELYRIITTSESPLLNSILNSLPVFWRSVVYKIVVKVKVWFACAADDGQFKKEPEHIYNSNYGNGVPAMFTA